MDTKTSLSIQDYIKNINPDAKKRPHLDRTAASTDRHSRRFGQILASAQAGPERNVTAPKGMKLEAYRSAALRASNSRIRQILDKNQAVASPEKSPATGLQRPRHPAAAGVPGNRAKYRHALSLPTQYGSENFKKVREKIERSIEKAARKYNLPPDLLHAMVKAESNYEVRAVSPVGAQGLMQLMPDTARDLGVTNPFDIDQNINGGAQYMRLMLDRFNGNLELALAAYNAGPETVSRHGDKVPPYSETRTYIQRVTQHANGRAG